MNRLRFRDFRASSQASQLLGYCSNNTPKLLEWVNASQERLLYDPLAPEDGYWGGWVHMQFQVSQAQPFIVTPRDIARIMLLDVCKHPVFLRNQFYEYLEFSRGLQPKGCNQTGRCQPIQAYERETVPILQPVPTPSIIRAFPTNNSDVGKGCLIQGKDQNGLTVTSLDVASTNTISGEQITLQFPFTDTLNTFSSVTGIQKSVTYGSVEFFAVDPVTGTQTVLADMEAGETTSWYRRYFLDGLPNGCCFTPGQPVVIDALAKLDLVPVQSDSDYLLIQSLAALVEECTAVRMLGMEDRAAHQLAATHHATALRLLNGQLTHFLGYHDTAIKVSLFGSQRVRPSFA